MANKLKETVPYFPFFVADGRTFFVLKKHYGALGIGYFTELFRLLSRTPGHVFSMRDDFDRERLLDFIGSKEKPVTEVEMFEFLDLLSSTGKIDTELWHNKRLVVSEDFLETLQEAYRRRKAKCPTIETVREEYKSLPDIDFIPVKNETVGNMTAICRQYVGNMTAICRQYVGNMTATPAQSKVKKSKVKESKPIEAAKAAIVPVTEKKESELYNSIKIMFEQKQPQQRFTDYGKEGKAIHGLIKKAEGYNPEDPGSWLRGLIMFFYQLRQTDRFFAKQPFLPSALNASGIFDRVLNELKTSWEAERAVNYEEIPF